MKIRFRFTAKFRWALALMLGSIAAHAQEFTAFGGASASRALKFDSYSWLLDYRQGLLDNIDASLTWINEGHFVAGVVPHHRDGLALQGWYDLPLPSLPFGISIGAGADYYFDSQQIGMTSLDIHGFAPVASADLKWYPDPHGRWLVRLRAMEIAPLHDPNHLLVDAGVGYYFGLKESSHATKLPTWREAVLESTEEKSPVEWTVLLGLSRINTFGRFGSQCSGTEVRVGALPHVDVTVGYLYEGKTSILRRSGFTGQAWLMSDAYPLTDWMKLGVGLGLGGYFNVSAKDQPPGASAPSVPFFAGLMTPSAYVELWRHWTARVMWHRVITSYNVDADVWLLGLGYRWR